MNRKKILVPVDLHQNSSELLLYAGKVAASISARISCVNVISDDIDQNPDLDDLVSTEISHRRKVEFELAEMTTKAFSNGYPEYDIIVTEGEFVDRIVSMTEELDIDLVITHLTQLVLLKELLNGISIPVIIVKGNTIGINSLVVPVNLESYFYPLVYESIDIADLLNSSLKVVPYSTTKVNEDAYKAKLENLKEMVQQENVPCSFNFKSCETGNCTISTTCPNVLETESILISFNELEEYLLNNDMLVDRMSFSFTILPIIKGNSKMIASRFEENSFN